MEPHNAICSEEKEIAGRAKENLDSDRLDEIASIEEQKAGVHTAMVDIAAIEKYPDGLDYAATVAMGYVMVANAPPSRPGELSNIAYDDMEKFCQGAGKGSDDYLVAAEGREATSHKGSVPDHIKSDFHKTSRKRGESGKYIAPGTKTCIGKYMDRKTYVKKGYFLKPARAKTEKVSMSKLLERGCALYTPGKKRFCVTLRRKQFETLSHEDEDGNMLKRAVADSNEHSEEMGKNIYRLRKAKSDAIKGRKVVAGIMEGAVPWPSAEDLTDDKLQARVGILREFYKKKPRADGTDEGVGAEDDEEDALPDDDDDDQQVFAEAEAEDSELESIGAEAGEVKEPSPGDLNTEGLNGVGVEPAILDSEDDMPDSDPTPKRAKVADIFDDVLREYDEAAAKAAARSAAIDID